MNENINLIEILKDAEGTKLWSSICGECTLLKVNKNGNIVSQLEYPISCEDNRGRFFSFTKEGKFFNDNNDTECILFPSKWNRNWSTFKVPKKHKHFEPFQRVLCIINDNDCKIWDADFYSHYDEDKKQHYLVSGVVKDDDNEIVPYRGNEGKLGKQVE